jgi:hypothetical protein
MTDGEERVRLGSSAGWRPASVTASGESYGQNSTVSTWAAGACKMLKALERRYRRSNADID